MAGELTQDELRLVAALRTSDWDNVAATVAVAMVTRAHRRPRAELLHNLRQYQGCENPVATDRALQLLITRGHVERQMHGATELIVAADTLHHALRAQLIEAGLDQLLDRLLARDMTEYVSVLGRIDSPAVYGTYEDALRGASTEILWPMVATSPALESVQVLKERAQAGVRIRILIASTPLATSLRGAGMRATSIEAIRGWKQLANDVPGMEVRQARKREALLFPSSTLIDKKLLRLNVHDPASQRSLAGVMLQFEAREGVSPNILTAVTDELEAAWSSAVPLHRGGFLWWRFKERWPWWAAAFFIIVAILGSGFGTVFVAITTSVAATFLFNALMADGRALMSWFRNVKT